MIDNVGSKAEYERKNIRILEFMDLPPELRVMIYTFLFTGMPAFVSKRWPTARQPGIARVSRLLRQESLPIFCSRATFTLELYHMPIGSSIGAPLASRISFDFEVVKDWLKNIGLENEALINHFLPVAWHSEQVKDRMRAEAELRALEKVTEPRPLEEQMEVWGSFITWTAYLEQ
jgi:hypothetical protein